MSIRHDWTIDEIRAIYSRPLMQLVFDAATIHREYHDPLEVQQSTLLSIKTGGCPEDCAYCPQAARYHTNVDAQALMQVDEVLEAAKQAKAAGSSRFCLGAAWREVRDNEHFDRVLDMVRGISAMNMEVCCTLGMLNEDQARRLSEAGVYAYNHNIDSSEDYYKEIIHTRDYENRLNTLKNVRKTNMTICCGGIIGMGEKESDRLGMLQTLSAMSPHPESVPINALVAVEGTPMEEQPEVPIWDMVRMIATARILMPSSVVRLSAGRVNMSDEGQALCFMAGANSIFSGDRLLTTPNPETDRDAMLFDTLGLHKRPAYKEVPKGVAAEA